MISLDLENIKRTHLNDLLRMSLAAIANYKPWVSELHFVYDENLFV